MSYQPPYKLTDEILSLVAQISEAVGRFSERSLDEMALRLRRINRIRTVTGSLAIEGNTLSETQISAILEGKQVVAPAKESDCTPFIYFMLERVKEALDIRNTPEVSPYVTPEVKRLLEVLEGEMSAQQLMLAMGLKDEKHFRQQYRQPALSAGMIEMTQPDKPRSSKQQYRLTDRGRLWKISRQDKADEQVNRRENGQ